PVVPAVGDEVAVDVGVRSRRAAEAAVASAADHVVIHVLQIRPALVVADDVVAVGVEQADGLRAGGVGGVRGLVPRAAVMSGVMNFAALNDEPLEGLAA